MQSSRFKQIASFLLEASEQLPTSKDIDVANSEWTSVHGGNTKAFYSLPKKAMELALLLARLDSNWAQKSISTLKTVVAWLLKNNVDPSSTEFRLAAKNLEYALKNHELPLDKLLKNKSVEDLVVYNKTTPPRFLFEPIQIAYPTNTYIDIDENVFVILNSKEALIGRFDESHQDVEITNRLTINEERQVITSYPISLDKFVEEMSDGVEMGLKYFGISWD